MFRYWWDSHPIERFKIGIAVERAGEKRDEKVGVVTDAHGMPEEHLWLELHVLQRRFHHYKNKERERFLPCKRAEQWVRKPQHMPCWLESFQAFCERYANLLFTINILVTFDIFFKKITFGSLSIWNLLLFARFMYGFIGLIISSNKVAPTITIMLFVVKKLVRWIY